MKGTSALPHDTANYWARNGSFVGIDKMSLENRYF
jgi:hypothetical protein